MLGYLETLDLLLGDLGFRRKWEPNYTRYYHNPRGDYTITIETRGDGSCLYSNCVGAKWSVDFHDFVSCMEDMMRFILEGEEDV